jgi:hypothetical protein
MDAVLVVMACGRDQEYSSPQTFPGLSTIEVGNLVAESFLL